MSEFLKRLDIGLIGRRVLTSEDVQALVFQSIELISIAQDELYLPICPSIKATRKRLKHGIFKTTFLPKKSDSDYRSDYGFFDPPSTISLDSYLPFFDWPMNIPDAAQSMTHYITTHEVIHADDYTRGDHIFHATKEHIIRDHEDKLEKGMQIINVDENNDCIRSYEDLASLWAKQFVDLLTHYRAYVVMRHHCFPRLDLIWDSMQDDIFPPSLLTTIEIERDTRYIFDTMILRAGSYCIIDALMETKNISAKNANVYTV
jgi:hypothetical protein